jgi:hypothetical protein
MPLDVAAELELLELEVEVEVEGFLVERYSLRTQRRCLSYIIAAHPGTLPLVIETLLPAVRTVITLPLTLGSLRTFTPAVA